MSYSVNDVDTLTEKICGLELTEGEAEALRALTGALPEESEVSGFAATSLMEQDGIFGGRAQIKVALGRALKPGAAGFRSDGDLVQ